MRAELVEVRDVALRQAQGAFAGYSGAHQLRKVRLG
jgi:hypothetical protein